MAKRITVDPARLTDAAGRIESSAAEYQQTYSRLYTEVQAMSAAWEGADNAAFTTQIESFRNDFELMHRLMLEYSTFLRQSATSYSNTQDHIIQQASRLVN